MNMVAATGHLNCTKGARLYLQKMVKLEAYYPWVYQHLQTKVSIELVGQTSFELGY